MEVGDASYHLRPEIVESTYYLYQYTNDEKYLQMGKTFFDDFVKYCKTDEGYAVLKSVVTKEKSDTMHSFLFAETFKYYYLLFAPPKTLDFKKVVFNTEAHPIIKRTGNLSKWQRKKQKHGKNRKENLITGGTGFLGTHIVRQFLDAGEKNLRVMASSVPIG